VEPPIEPDAPQPPHDRGRPGSSGDGPGGKSGGGSADGRSGNDREDLERTDHPGTGEGRDPHGDRHAAGSANSPDGPDFGLATDFYTFAPDSLAQLLPGFAIHREVGKGSMGIVYEATRRWDGQRVAIKVLPPSLTLTERALARFLREGELMSKVRHPSIVGVHEFGTKARLHYFVMEFVDGMTLDERLSVGPLPVRQVAEIGVEIGRALQFAHDHGIVHRDVKPGNLILRQPPSEDSRVAITDFGLARETGTGSMTESGAIVGTPMFMAPEQILGDRAAVGAQSDVYGLGATLYTLLTRRVPFGGPTAQSVLRQVLDTDPVRPHTLRADTPPDLEAILLKAMEKEPARRYGTAAEMADDLQRFLAGERVLARLPGVAERTLRVVRRRPVTVGLTALVVLLTILAWMLQAESRVRRLEKDLAEAESNLARVAAGRDDQFNPLRPTERQRLLHQAEAHASAVLASDPTFHRARFVRAKARQRLGDHRGAVSDLDAAAELQGPTPEILTYRIEALSRLHDESSRARLLSDLRSLLEQDDGPAACSLVASELLRLASIAAPDRRAELVGLAARAIARIPADTSQARVLRARKHELDGHVDLAVREMRAAVDAFRGDLTVHTQAAEMFARLGLVGASQQEAAIVRRAGGVGTEGTDGSTSVEQAPTDEPPVDFGVLRGLLDDLEGVLEQVDAPAGEDGATGGEASGTGTGDEKTGG
jgi:hypothetical protein